MSPLATIIARFQPPSVTVEPPGAIRLAAPAPLRARRRLGLVAALAGPGIIVMLAENDGPSMLSYATTGATFGIGFFVPFIVLTFAMAFVVQELAARLGIATNRGHARLIFERFGRGWGRFAIGDLIVGNVLTLVTEFIAVVAGASYFGVTPLVAVLATAAVAVTAFAVRRYRVWERAVIVLALGNFLFVGAAAFAHPDGHGIARAIVSWKPLPTHGLGFFLTMIMANIGATVTPWMIFFQQSAVADKGLTRADLPAARVDTGLGALAAAVVAIAAIVASSPLFAHHVDVARLMNGGDYAAALRPYLGNAGAALFALGMIEAGLVAVLTISASSAYAIGDLCRRTSSGAGLRNERLFYLAGIASIAAAGLVVLVPNAPLLGIAIAVNVLAAVLMLPALVFLLLLVNDRDVAHDLVNSPLANVAGVAIVGGISIVGVLYAVVTVFPGLAPR